MMNGGDQDAMHSSESTIMCCSLFFLDRYSHFFYAHPIKKSLSECDHITKKESCRLSSKKDGMLNINNISVKDQRPKHYHPSIFYPKKPHSTLVSLSREKNAGLKEYPCLLAQIKKSNQSVGKTKSQVINRVLNTYKRNWEEARLIQ